MSEEEKKTMRANRDCVVTRREIVYTLTYTGIVLVGLLVIAYNHI